MIKRIQMLRDAIEKYSAKLRFLYSILNDEQYRLLDEWEESQ